MKLIRRIAALALLVACLWLLPTGSRAQCSDACADCMSNAENYYYSCLNWCSLTGHGFICQWQCNNDYQQQLELCESL